MRLRAQAQPRARTTLTSPPIPNAPSSRRVRPLARTTLMRLISRGMLTRAVSRVAPPSAGAAPRANHVDAADQPGHADAGCQPGRAAVERSAPRPPAGIGHPHPERAAQFKPFAALRGYYELVSACERVVEPRPVLSEEESRELSERHPHPERAAQFKPFAALRGYYELVSACERVVEPRPVLSEEESRELSERLLGLTRGEVVRVAYYEAGSIVTQTGAVGQLDTVGRTLAVVRKRVPIDDIVSLERCET